MRQSTLKILTLVIVGAFILLFAGCVDKKGILKPIITAENAGDINDNDIANEIADAVMFSNYFMTGTAAFGDHITASVSASDVNGDGKFLGVADLVYLVRVVTGDASLYPKPVPETPVVFSHEGSTISYLSPVNLGATFLIFDIEGEIGTPSLGDGAVNMDLKYQVNGDRLNVLIYNIGTEEIEAGENTLLTVPGNSHLLAAEAASYDGFPLKSEIRDKVFSFSVINYPNPFSTSTTIALSLPTASEYVISIWDVDGDFVIEYSGYAEAGVLNIVWDGTDSDGDPVPNGVYFYKVTVGDQTVTRWMVLQR